MIAQTVEDWELIIVDDASTDGTTGCRLSLSETRAAGPASNPEHQPRSCPHTQPRLDYARGHLIAFIDSDDVWYPEKTAKQIAAMTRHQADISYTAYKRRRDGEQGGTVVAVPAHVTYRTMLRRNLIACSTAIVRRSTCGTLRMPQIIRRQDHGYWLALLRDGSRTTVGVTEPLVWYRIHHDSLSAK